MHRIKYCLTLVGILVFSLSLSAQQTTSWDSALFSAAPETCWMYSNWNAAVEYDANSRNQAEQLLAEPEVKSFIDDLIKRLGLLGPALASNESEEKRELIHSIGPKLTNVMFKRAGCFFLENLEVSRNQQIENVKAGLILDAGDDAVKLANQLEQLLTKDGDQGSRVTLEGVDFYKLMVNVEFKTELFIGSSNGMLMMGLDEQTIRGMLNRMAKKQAPSWLQAFKSNQQIKRVTSIGYFNAKEMRRAMIPLAGPAGDMMVSMTGLGNVDSVETCSGFSETEAVSRMLVRIDGRPEGLMDLSSREGIQSAELQPFPKDSLFAFGLSLDPGRLFRFIEMTSFQLNQNQDDFALMLEEFKRETGVDLKRDVVENLGATWTLHNGAGDGWMTGLTLMGTVKDGQKLTSAVNRLIKKILMETNGDPYGPRFSKRKIGDFDLLTFRFGELGLPFEPSWCVTEEKIIFGLYPQAVQTALTANPSSSLIDQSELAFLTQPFSGNLEDAKLLAMVYSDTATQFEFSYPYLQIMMSMSRNMIEQMSDLPPEVGESVADLMRGLRLPPARTIHRHLQPSLAAIRQTEMGIEFESRQTIPALDASFIAPLAVGMLLPAVQEVRGAARRTESANNIRQQILAALNYESAFRKFPAGYSTNAKGEKLLSWRVHVLPFIEEQVLYQQFKLDEPWDSDNNKPLVEKMPNVFRSPMSKAKPGMTVYRGVGGRTGVLGPPRKDGAPLGAGFADIIDGSSNTMFVVEASDQLAVPWTQPDEGLDPQDFDLKTIFGLYPQGTNVGMCDGSVQFISKEITTETFRFLMEMNDGNIIPDLGNFSDRPSRRPRNVDRRPDNKAFEIDNGEVELTVDNMLSEVEKAVLEDRKKLDALRQVVIAMHNFHDAHNRFPSAFTTDNEGKPLLSWRVHLLPYLEEFELYERFHLDEPWDSEHNRGLMKELPSCYRLGNAKADDGKTTVLATGGANGVIQKPTEDRNGQMSGVGIGFASIQDGSSNTIMLVNAGDEFAVEWTKPSEFVPDEAALKKLLGQKNGIAVTLTDGSAWELPAGFPVETFKAMLTIAGDEDLGNWQQNLKK